MRFAALLIYEFLSLVYICIMDNDIYTTSPFMFYSISMFGSLSPDVGTVACLSCWMISRTLPKREGAGPSLSLTLLSPFSLLPQATTPVKELHG